MNKIITLIFIAVWSTAIAQESGFKQVNAHQFHELATAGKGMILDVRTKSEFDNEHIANSQYLNFYALDFKKKLLMLPKDEEIYLYCTTGYRSEKAAKYLAKNGYTKVYNLEHGILEWNLENLPVIEGEPSAKLMADKVSTELFKQTVSSDSLVLIDFYATWCGPCRKMMPLIDSIRTQYHPKMKVFKVNVDVSKKLIKQEKIIGVPLFRIYRSGKLLFEKDGMLTRKELEDIIDKLLFAKTP
jgi:thioredoxin